MIDPIIASCVVVVCVGTAIITTSYLIKKYHAIRKIKEAGFFCTSPFYNLWSRKSYTNTHTGTTFKMWKNISLASAYSIYITEKRIKKDAEYLSYAKSWLER